jgi:hypothetical protein
MPPLAPLLPGSYDFGRDMFFSGIGDHDGLAEQVGSQDGRQGASLGFIDVCQVKRIGSGN